MTGPNAASRPFAEPADAWRFLADVTDWEKMRKFGAGKAEWSLEPTRRLLAHLGRPERAMHVVHVAGTKGKGSTARWIATALSESGATTGLYTSPHVDDALERISIDGSSLGSDAFVAGMNRLHPALAGAEGAAPTFFEIFTALALGAFADRAADVAVLETGLGGRFDATNAIERAAVSVITTVSRDHTHLLGETVRAIAAEKAGIVRDGVPVVTGVRPGEAALGPIVHAARAHRAPLAVRGWAFDVVRYEPTEIGGRLDARVGDREWRDVELGVLGAVQAANAAVALQVLEILERTHGVSVDERSLRRAWRAMRLPGRMERARIPGHAAPIVIDGAHNAASAIALATTVRAHFPGRPVRLVFGLAGDKLVDETAEPLFALAASVHATRTQNPRSLDPARLGPLAARAGTPLSTHAHAAAALDAALDAAGPDDVVVAAGSLYLAGELRAHLGLSPDFLRQDG